MGLERAGGSYEPVAPDPDRLPRHLLDALAGDAPGAEDHELVAGAVDDRGLHADRARPVVEDDVDVVTEVGAYVAGGRRAHVPEAVRRGCRDAAAERTEQRQRHRLVGHAHADGVAATGHCVEDACRAPDDDRERAGPQRVAEAAGGDGDVRRPVVELSGRADVDDHRVLARAALDRIQPRERAGVVGVGAQSVHGLGREGHQASAPERVGSTGDVGVSRHVATIFPHPRRHRGEA